MNTPSAIDKTGTNLPPAELCERHVAEVRVLFQRTLANWASDVLLLRQRDSQNGIAPGDPVWGGPSRGSLISSHPEDFDEWSQAA